MQRLDKHPQDTVGLLRPVKQQKLEVFLDQGAEKVTPGNIVIGPEYVLVFEQDFRKIANGAKKYNNAVEMINSLVKEGKLSQEIANKILNNVTEK